MFSKRIDLTGKKFNRWTVLEYAYTKEKVVYWKCVCDCGNERNVVGSSLKNNGSRSCGCYRSWKNATKNIQNPRKYNEKEAASIRQSIKDDNYWNKLIWMAILPNITKGWVKKSIMEKVAYLYEEYDITRAEMYEEITFKFLEHKYINRYDMNRCRPSTFVLHHVNSILRHIIEKCKRGTFGVDTLKSDAMKKDWNLEELDTESSAKSDDPEHHLAAKEIFEFTEKFFGLEDFKVLTGEIGVEERSLTLGIKPASFEAMIKRKMPEYRKIIEKDYLL